MLAAPVRQALAETRWQTVIQYASTTSTNDEAIALVRQRRDPHVVVTAAKQTAGRGRLGRRWMHTTVHGDEPESLAVTATVLAGPNAPMVPLAVGLAAYDALVDLTVQPTLKWPNDVLLDARKLAGILVERVPVDGHDLIVVGTGFNLDWRDVVREEHENWTSVAEHTGAAVDSDRLLASYLKALHRWLIAVDTTDGIELLLDTYRKRCVTLGQAVTVTLANGQTVTGVAKAVSARGELQLEDDGTLVTVTSGDVWHDLDGPRPCR